MDLDRQKVLKFHPDKGSVKIVRGKSESVFSCIQKAYEVGFKGNAYCLISMLVCFSATGYIGEVAQSL